MFPPNWQPSELPPGVSVDVADGALFTWRELKPGRQRDWIAPDPGDWEGVAVMPLLALAAAARAAERWQPYAGIRVWSAYDGYLRSLRSNARWRSTMTAVCADRGHPAPQHWCECGLYAVKPAAHRRLAYWPGSAVGVVSVFGRVVEHENGYRAQHARVREVWVPDAIFCGLDLRAYPGVTWHTYTWRKGRHG